VAATEIGTRNLMMFFEEMSSTGCVKTIMQLQNNSIFNNLTITWCAEEKIKIPWGYAPSIGNARWQINRYNAFDLNLKVDRTISSYLGGRACHLTPVQCQRIKDLLRNSEKLMDKRTFRPVIEFMQPSNSSRELHWVDSKQVRNLTGKDNSVKP